MSTEEQILKELEKYRSTGSLKDLPSIFELLRDNPEGQIANACVTLLADIKDNQMTLLMLEALHLAENKKIQKQLLQVCWESGLDYSPHLVYLLDLFLTTDYLGALEAFTLIENTLLDQQVDELVKKELVAKIRAVILDLPDHNKTLGLELIHLLEGR